MSNKKVNPNATVILARVSSKAQEDEGYSLDAQFKLLQNYCDSKNLDVVKTFKIAETASKEQGRKIFHELLAYINTESIYHLAVEKTDRLTRNFRDAVAIDDWLEKNTDRRLHAVKESLLLHREAKSDVKFMWNIHISVAKKYTDNLREESMKGWAEKLAQGWIPAPPPPGYKTVIVNGKKLHAPDEDTRGLMVRAFEKYLDPSQSIQTVTKELELVGIRTRKGRCYHKSQVQHILNNPYYIGVIRFDGKEYPGAHEPIIDRGLFERVQYKLHNKRPPVQKKHNPVLKNLISCKTCGGVVTWQLQKGRYYGTCQRLSKDCQARKLLREDKVEEAIVKQLEKLVCPSQEIIEWAAQAVRQKHLKDIESRERIVLSLQTQIARLSSMDEMLYEDKLAGDISRDKYNQKHQTIITQKAELEEKLANIDANAAKQLDQKLVLLELSQKAAKLYPTKSIEQKRLIITKLFKELTYNNGSVSVIYSNFARAIAQNVLKTNELLGGKK